ncbi:MAG: hypothetical protein HQ521_13115 [Bacteroidetes bacterium]|nr:hypothetical protein [Bacteroidota bacterium]
MRKICVDFFVGDEKGGVAGYWLLVAGYWAIPELAEGLGSEFWVIF